MRNANGAQTVVPARNDFGVSHSPDLPVEMRVENKTTFVIVGRTSREDLATVPASPASGVPIHVHDSDDVTEGTTNLFFTDERARDALGAALVEGTGIDITVSDVGDTITIASTITAYTDEMAQDAVGGMFTGNVETDIAATYQDATAKIDLVVSATLVGDRIHAATGKTTPVDADELGVSDSAASWVLKKLTWANVKATLKTYLDTLYAALVHTHHTTSAWTPTITGSVSNPTTLTFFAQEGRYSQDGDRVYFTFRLSINSISGGSGDARISLPVTAAALGAVNDTRCAMSLSGVPVAAGAFGANFRVQNGAAYGIAQQSVGNGAIVSTQIADLATTDVLAATGFYYV